MPRLEERLLDGGVFKRGGTGERRRPEVPHQRRATMISPMGPAIGVKGERGLRG